MSKRSSFEFCKSINKRYGCPPIPDKYAGQLEVGCRVWEKYGNKIYNEGDTWWFDDQYAVELSGFKFHKYWPAYCYHIFSCILLKEGLINDG